MSIADKLTTVAKNMPKVYNAGYDEGYKQGYELGEEYGYGNGYADGDYVGYENGYAGGYSDGYFFGTQAEYDRFWDTYQQNGNRKLYRRAFSGYCWTEELLKPKYFIKPDPTVHQHSHANAMFEYCGQPSGGYIDATHICSMIDLSAATKVQNLFNNAIMKNISVDLSNAENAQSAFGAGDAGGIQSITSLRISEKCTNGTNIFYYQRDIEKIMFTPDSVIAFNNLDIQRSTKLDYESLLSIINALKDYSEDTSGTTWTVKLGEANIAKLTAEDLNNIEAKGWTYQ